MNAYTAGSQKVIPAVLLYAFYQGKVLLIQVPPKANKKAIWNGLGGKLELGENAREAAAREFEEESNVRTSAHEWRWAGQLYFPNFNPAAQQDWSVTVFTLELSQSQKDQLRPVNSAHSEGMLSWFDSEEALALPMYEADSQFLPFVLRREAFEGSIFYLNGSCARSEVRSIKL